MNYYFSLTPNTPVVIFIYIFGDTTTSFVCCMYTAAIANYTFAQTPKQVQIPPSMNYR